MDTQALPVMGCCNYKDGLLQLQIRITRRLHRLKNPCYDLWMKHWSLTFCLVIAALFGSFGVAFAGSDLPKCPSSGYFDNCFGTWSAGNGYKYVGEWRNDKQNGQGTVTWSAPHSSAGEKYVGELRNNKKN